MPRSFLAFAPLLFVLLWSTGFIGTKGAALNADPFAYLTLRFAIAAALMAVLTLATRSAWPTRVQGWRAAVTGLLLHAGYLGGVTYAIWLHLPAGISSVMVGLQPLLTALLSWPLVGERVTARQWAGLMLGFLGVLLIVLGRGSAGGAYPAGALLATVFALGCTTAGTLYQRRYGAGMPLLSGTATQYTASALVMGGMMLMHGGAYLNWTPQFIFSLTWLVLVLSVGAILLLMVLIREMPAARVGSLFYLVPPFVVVEAYLLYGERLTLLAVLGLGLSVAGVALSAWRGKSEQDVRQAG
ncbi:DMT family transporter [Deinococcus hopiensis]|uniref:Threonine/homoserine efflux transporter RhtA n=1 Tax=Deinococcus hopiensis KR-140 TaxID=695939 RepID=A0A1W1UB45_9DEIO|nr:DMT family transporter [Deinococcus hopiensis]SMB78328.1 Threonine/homoserine efflux transporter RhtA [Deinococcus hopiensis KR-140]